MSSLSDDRGEELRQIFFESAREILQSLNEEALRLEKYPDDLEALRSLRRAVHTLKGDSAACGYKELAHLAHEFEDVLSGEDLTQSASTVETALAAADVFSEMIEAYRNGTQAPTGEQLRKLIAQLGVASKARSSSAKEDKPAGKDKGRASKNRLGTSKQTASAAHSSDTSKNKKTND